jgi:hypothetical protein
MRWPALILRQQALSLIRRIAGELAATRPKEWLAREAIPLPPIEVMLRINGNHLTGLELRVDTDRRPLRDALVPALIDDKAFTRLKICPSCDRLFLATTNTRRQNCSKECANRRYSRDHYRAHADEERERKRLAYHEMLEARRRTTRKRTRAVKFAKDRRTLLDGTPLSPPKLARIGLESKPANTTVGGYWLGDASYRSCKG